MDLKAAVSDSLRENRAPDLPSPNDSAGAEQHSWWKCMQFKIGCCEHSLTVDRDRDIQGDPRSTEGIHPVFSDDAEFLSPPVMLTPAISDFVLKEGDTKEMRQANMDDRNENQDEGFISKTLSGAPRYEGQLENGLKQGIGSLLYPDGDHYDGEFDRGMAHGHGTFTSKRSSYVGEWKNDVKHGNAVEEWDDTSKYTGQYYLDQRHGKGKFEWPDGSIYEGSFVNNIVHGEGTFTWKDGRRYKGQWKDNRMHGEGRYDWPDGRAYEGQYSNDLKDGEGFFLWADGRIFTGQWKDGKQHGKGLFRTAQGDERIGKWKDGIRTSWVDPSPTREIGE